METKANYIVVGTFTLVLLLKTFIDLPEEGEDQ